LFSGQLKSSLQGYGAQQVFDKILDGKEFKDPLRMVQYLDFHSYLPGDILTKVDRASMAHSLEVRVPLLDYQFVESVARLPTSIKRAQGEPKFALKESLRPYLPREVLYRTKMGFAVPLDVWFRGSLKEELNRSVMGERLKDSGFFNPDMLDTMVQDHHSGRRDYSSPLWSLLMFDRFLESRA
jgi:asparagine synthase (glutamine-hydrolysing)